MTHQQTTKADALEYARSRFCPDCKERDIIKYGKYESGTQIYYCKPCKRNRLFEYLEGK